MIITLICNLSLALFSVVLLIIHFRKSTEFEFNMVLCDGDNIVDFSTWLYIFIYHSICKYLYIYNMSQKNGIIALELFGSVFLFNKLKRRGRERVKLMIKSHGKVTYCHGNSLLDFCGNPGYPTCTPSNKCKYRGQVQSYTNSNATQGK